MAEYVEVSKVLMYIADTQLAVSDDKPTPPPRDACEWIFQAVKDMPTIDIVRCKECKYFCERVPCVGGINKGCTKIEGREGVCYKVPNENFFCGYGERSE